MGDLDKSESHFVSVTFKKEWIEHLSKECIQENCDFRNEIKEKLHEILDEIDYNKPNCKCYCHV